MANHLWWLMEGHVKWQRLSESCINLSTELAERLIFSAKRKSKHTCRVIICDAMWFSCFKKIGGKIVGVNKKKPLTLWKLKLNLVALAELQNTTLYFALGPHFVRSNCFPTNLWTLRGFAPTNSQIQKRLIIANEPFYGIWWSWGDLNPITAL